MRDNVGKIEERILCLSNLENNGSPIWFDWSNKDRDQKSWKSNEFVNGFLILSVNQIGKADYNFLPLFRTSWNTTELMNF